MKYLIAYTETGASQFCQASFSKLQPSQKSGVTSSWTTYTLHPTTNVPLILVPESFEVPVLADIDVALFDFAFKKYLDANVITQVKVDELKTQALSAAGGRIDIGAAIVALFQGTTVLIDYTAAVDGGWFETT